MLKIEIALAFATLSSVVFTATFTSKTIPKEWIIWGRVFGIIGLVASLPGLIEAIKYFLAHLPESEMVQAFKRENPVAYAGKMKEPEFRRLGGPAVLFLMLSTVGLRVVLGYFGAKVSPVWNFACGVFTASAILLGLLWSLLLLSHYHVWWPFSPQ
ncbi:MAG: hypothetical protein WAX38_04135 [Minisyncoccia bacterium]